MIILLVIGLPIGFALMALSIILLTISGYFNTLAITQKTVTSLESFTMLAIPFFMMAGATMSETDVSKKDFSIRTQSGKASARRYGTCKHTH